MNVNRFPRYEQLQKLRTFSRSTGRLNTTLNASRSKMENQSVQHQNNHFSSDKVLEHSSFQLTTLKSSEICPDGVNKVVTLKTPTGYTRKAVSRIQYLSSLFELFLLCRTCFSGFKAFYYFKCYVYIY